MLRRPGLHALQGYVNTEKSLVNVEDMTLRLWVADVDSVWFGPQDRRRALMSIRGLPDEAERLSQQLAGFARQQATVIAPQSDADMQRLAVMNRISPPAAAVGRLGGVTPEALSTPGGASMTTTPPTTAAVPATPRFCAQCGSKLDAGARFCSNCGTQLAAST